MSYNQDNVEDAESSDPQIYSGEAFDRFVQESQTYISELTAENAGLKEQLEQEKQARLESEDSVDNSVRILSTAERVAAEYIAEVKEQANAERVEADEYSKVTKADADAYHASIVSKAQDDLALIVGKVNAKISTYKEVTERLEAFHRISLENLVSPLEDVAILKDEIEEPVPSELHQSQLEEEKVWVDAAVIYDDYINAPSEDEVAVENTLEEALNEASIDAVTTVEEDPELAEAVDALETEDVDIPGFDAVEPAWEADEDSDVAENVVAEQTENSENVEEALVDAMREEPNTVLIGDVGDAEVGILELDFEDADTADNVTESAVNSEEVAQDENSDEQNDESYLELDLSNVDDDEEGK